MAAQPSGKLLGATRGVIYFILVILGIAAGAIVFAAIALPFNLDRVTIEVGKARPQLDINEVLPWLYVVFALVLTIIATVWTILQKLLAIIATVAEGDPFVHANAARLKAIGWMTVAINVVGLPLALAAAQVADRFGENDVDFDGVSLTGILAILLTFVLAGVFEQGARLREEMEGTV